MTTTGTSTPREPQAAADAWSAVNGSLDLATVRSLLDSRRLTVTELVNVVYERIERSTLPHVWITHVPRQVAMGRAAKLDRALADGAAEKLPLLGVPFAVKDNIDLAGMMTTAACVTFGHTAERSATVIDRLVAAGAVLIGKTNMDQFATGLVGTRSDYGACVNVFDPRFISGGSSSGSAVAVAGGLVSFALGTDTAGSGRVPAALGNIIGVKPTRGLVSTAGVVPACRSLDCVSIFALTCGDGDAVLRTARGVDVNDPYSRAGSDIPLPTGTFRFGVPELHWLEFYGDDKMAAIYEEAIGRLESLGGARVTIDYEPFHRAGELLYNGPWVVERAAELQEFLSAHADRVLPVTLSVLKTAEKYTALDVVRAQYELQRLHSLAAAQWKSMDVLLLPTTPTVYSVEQVQRDPIELNTKLGIYTRFVNLLDCCAVAVPAGFRDDGLPAGISLIAPAWRDASLLRLAAHFHERTGVTMGTTTQPVPAMRDDDGAATATIPLAVVGAHLKGQPLNSQLTDLGATLARSCTTAPAYRLYALANTTPPKPGLVRVAANGAAIAVEVWDMPIDKFGAFIVKVPPPLAIGTIELEDGTLVKGFLCEPHAVQGATDISHHGGWLNYLAARR